MDLVRPKLLEIKDTTKIEGEETMYESFVLPESEGFSLDFIQKNRTGDTIRRNFMSKLTYKNVWLTPL